MLDAIWPDQYVNDTAVKKCVMDIRRALNDKPPYKFIRTEGRSGYRFVRNVKEVDLSEATLELMPQEGHHVIVERDTPLAVLSHALDQAEQHMLQIVMVTGEAGIGKTTVVQQFLHRLSNVTEVALAQGYCVEHYGFGEPYRPFLDALQRLGMSQGKRRIATLLRRLAPLCLRHLPSLTTERQRVALQQELSYSEPGQMVRELVTVFETLAQERLVVIVLEDLHWSDAATLDVLVALAKLRSAKLLVIGTYRPEEIRLEDYPIHAAISQLLTQNECRVVELQTLSVEAVAAYIAIRYPNDQPFIEHAELLQARTGGNPFFLSEMLRYLTTQGSLASAQDSIDEFLETTIPQQVRLLVDRQFGQLTPDEQVIVQVASVAGEVFPTEVVAAALRSNRVKVEELLAGLARNRRFFRPVSPMRWPDGTYTSCFQFRHILQQQAIYDGLTLSKRIGLHLAIAQRLELGFSSQVSTIATDLSRHFAEGNDLLQGARYAYLAGQAAEARSGYIESVGYYTKSLELLGQAGQPAETIPQELQGLLALGQSLGIIDNLAGDEVAQAYKRIYAMCKPGNEAHLSYALAWLNSLHIVRGEFQIIIGRNKQVIDIAREQNNETLLLSSYSELGPILLHQGRLLEAHQYLQLAVDQGSDLPLDTYPSFFVFDPPMGFLAHLSWGLWLLGFPDQSLMKGQEALARARQVGTPSTLAYAFLWMAITHLTRREPLRVQEQSEAALALATDPSFAFVQALGTFLRGWALAEQGLLQEGFEQMQEGLMAHGSTGAKLARPWWLALLAQISAKRGDIKGALEAISEAHRVIEETGERAREAEVYRVEGELLLMLDSPIVNKAEQCFQRALSIARGQEAKSWELRAAWSLARLWGQQDQRQEAQRLLAPLYHWFTEGFDTPDLHDAQALLDALSGET